MATIEPVDGNAAVEEMTLIEGFPGVGLVGKIAADHLIEVFGMRHHANIFCAELPAVAVYHEEDATLRPPMRLYVDEDRSLVVLQSDVPVGPAAAAEIAECLEEWSTGRAIRPIYLSGIPRDQDAEGPRLYGVGNARGVQRLEAAGIATPAETGLISGPTGVLLHHAIRQEASVVGLVVGSDPRFPDPEAAEVLVRTGIAPLVDVEIPVDELIDSAEQIRAAKQRLAQQMQEAQDESTQARPIGMYQ
jgi:Archaeal enzymes of ATP-grasp superfamily